MKVLAALVLALVLLPASPAGAQGPPGSLTLLGCRATAPAPSGCADESSLSGTAGVAFAPDGKEVYVAARNPGTLLVYARDAATGVLVRTACFSGTDAPGCTTVPPLAGAAEVAIPADGRNVYVTTSLIGGPGGTDKDDGVVEFSRAANGALTFTGCVGQAAPCTVVAALDQNGPIAVSPDGLSVYVGSQKSGLDAVVAFTRSATGTLSFVNCLALLVPGCGISDRFSTPSGIVVSPDGRQVYVSNYNTPYRVVALNRETGTGALSAPGTCVGSPEATDCAATHPLMVENTGLTMSANGRFLYTTDRYPFGGEAVILIRRNPTDGTLSFPPHGCWETPADTDGAGCTKTPGMEGPDHLVLTPNEAHAYVMSIDAGGVLTFDRDGATGMLAQQLSPSGCLLDGSVAGCGTLPGNPAHGLFAAVSPDGRELVATGDISDTGPGRLWSFAIAPEPTPVPTPVPTVAPTPTPTPRAVTLPPPATPVAGVRANAGLVSGSVTVTLPDGVTAALTGAASIPVGSTVDARQGTLTLTTATAGRKATRQSARVAAGIFRIRQRRARAQTDLVLVSAAGAESRCAGATARHPKKGVVRSLSVAVTKGVFRTLGGAATAAAKGRATWSATDRCDGTLVSVKQGRVAVTARGKRARTVSAGHALLVRARLFTARQHGA